MLVRRGFWTIWILLALSVSAVAQVDILWRNSSLGGGGYAVAYSPDGRYLSLAITDIANPARSRVVVWDTADGALVYTLPHPGGCNDVMFSRDGRYLLSGGNQVRVWRLADGSLERTITTGAVWRMRLSPDGSILATVNLTAREIFLWRFSDGALLRTITIGSNPVFDFSPDGEYLISAVGDGRFVNDNYFRLWRVATGELVRSTPMPYETYAISVSPDGAYYATAHWDYLYLWRFSDGSMVWRVNSGARDVEFSPDGTRLLASGNTGFAELRRASDGALERTLIPRGDSSTSWDADFAPTGAQLSVARAGDGSGFIVATYETATGRLLRRQPGHFRQVNFVETDGVGEYLCTGGSDSVCLWRASDGALLATLLADTNVRGVALSPDGRYAAAAVSEPSGQSALYLWETQTRQLVRTVSLPGVEAVAFTPDNQKLVTLQIQNTPPTRQLRVWRINDGALEETYPISNNVRRLRISPDGQRIVLFDSDAVILRRDGTVAFALPWCWDAVFSRDSRTLIAVNTMQTLFYDVATGALTRSLNTFGAARIAVSPDSKYWLTVDAGSLTASLWRSRDGARVANYSIPGVSIFSVAYYPLGDFFVFGAFGGDVIAVRNPYPPLRGDVNFDGCVDDSDLLTVLFAFGSSERTADANRDGAVDDADLLIVLFQFGEGCE